MSSNPAHARFWLIDLDGVLYEGTHALPGAREFIDRLRVTGRRFRLVTNNATLLPEQYVARLAGIGITVEPEEVFTSALATARFLGATSQSPRTAVVIGEAGLRHALVDAGIAIVDENPDCVVVGLDRGLTYEKLAAAMRAILGGARFVGTNPDVSLPSERGLLPGAGSILAALRAATGREPTIVGKPQPLMLDMAMQQLDASSAETVMLGDRLDTDIAGARAAGVASIMVLTGVSTRDEAEHGSVRPDFIVENLPALLQVMETDR